jgi:O-antigen/teichoic acid export membrane protein
MKRISVIEQIANVKAILSSIGGLSLISLSSIFLFSIDLILVSFLLGLEATAEFSLMQKLYNGILLLTLPITTASWTSLRIAYDKKDTVQIKQMIIKISSIVLAISLFLGLTLTVFYPIIIQIWSGKLIQNNMLAILFWIYTILLSANSIFATYLIAVEKYKAQLIVNGWMIPVNLILSFILAKKMGSIGVLLATNIVILPLLATNLSQFFQTLKERISAHKLEVAFPDNSNKHY